MMIDRATVQQAIDALLPISTYGRVGSKDVEQAAAQAAITALREAIEEDEKTTAGHMGRAKLAALLEQGFSINGVAIERELENGEVERGAVTYGGMVLWWHPEQQAKPRMELYGWGVTGCLGVYRGEYDKQDAAAMARRLGGASRAFALHREASKP